MTILLKILSALLGPLLESFRQRANDERMKNEVVVLAREAEDNRLKAEQQNADKEASDERQKIDEDVRAAPTADLVERLRRTSQD